MDVQVLELLARQLAEAFGPVRCRFSRSRNQMDWVLLPFFWQGMPKVKPLSLLPLIALIFYDVSGGPFGIEVSYTGFPPWCAGWLS